jgi:hypothetical protein
VKEAPADIIKTPTLISREDLSVFEASAIGRYSESFSCIHHEVKMPPDYRKDPYLRRMSMARAGAGLLDCFLTTTSAPWGLR